MKLHSFPSITTKDAESIIEDASHLDDASAPHIVIRGESITKPLTICHQSLANRISFIDYLSVTYRPKEVEPDQFPLKNELIHLFNIPPQDWTQAKIGWCGYTNKVMLNGFGLIAWGGTSQRGTYHLELTGQGCARVKDWLDIYHWGTTNNIKITRLDIAHDDFEGDIVNISNTIKWMKKGLFASNGRPLKPKSINDHESGDGKTFNFGKRKNGRVIRIYEKGKELGDPDSPWCRAEVETRSKDRKLDWDAVINPDPYIAGSCKALSYLSAEQSRFKTMSKAKTISLDRAIKYCRVGYGQLIHVLHHVEGYEYEQIFEMLARDGIPEKLKHKYQTPSE